MKADLHPNLKVQKTLLKQSSRQSAQPVTNQAAMLQLVSTVQLQSFMLMVCTTTQNLKDRKVREKHQRNKLISLNSLFLNILSILSKTEWLKETGMAGSY